MNPAVSTQVHIHGLVRSPDREGALAHLDTERGFAFVARSAMSFSDVIDPTIWVKEKLALALATPAGTAEPPLRRAIAALRSVHAELMTRPERDRTWVSILLVLYGEGEGMGLIAGDCPCYRYRGGKLSRLGRTAPEHAEGPPAGALGSDVQVKLELVPLLPQVGDCYILSTHPLREGDLSILARDLSSARDERTILEIASSGTTDKGRVAIGVIPGGRPRPALDRPAVSAPEETAPLELEPIEPEGPVLPIEDLEILEESEPATPIREEILPSAAPRKPATGAPAFLSPAAAPDAAPPIETPAPEEPVAAESAAEPDSVPDPEPLKPPPDVNLPRPAQGAFVERRPWYEWVALWGGGALAIVALALIVRAIAPGILGKSSSPKPSAATAPLGTGALVDLFSDPPGATVKVDGIALEAHTPATAVSIAPGKHRVELNWGLYGSRVESLEVAPGARVAVRPRLLGSVGFRSSQPGRVLDVFVDGAYAGATPVVIESLVVGRHLVRFGGPGLSASAQEVEVLQGTRVELIGEPGPVPASGRVTIQSALLSDTGFEAGRGDPVWVDGEMRGVTPLTVELSPGTHSFRVVRRNFPPQISVLEVRPGGDQFVTGEFGEQSEEPLRFDPPASISLSDPLPFTISLPPGEWDSSMSVWLYATPPGGSYQGRPMTRVEESSRTFAALLPATVTHNASRQVKLYFKAVGTAGREVFSEIYTLPVKD